MLVVEVSVNVERPIEDILIHNFKEHKNGLCEYEVMDPNSPEERLVEETIMHKREKGYRSLLIEVLLMLERKQTKEGLCKDLRDFRREK